MQPTSIDINILINYQFKNPNSSDSWKKLGYNGYNRKHNDTLLGVRNGQLVTVQAKDVSIGQLFLRIFGKGKLAHTHVSLKSICHHLDKYNWKQFNNEQGANFEAYKKICTIAYKRLFDYYKTTWIRISAPQILKNNSDYIRTKHGDFYVNPATTAKDIQGMVWTNLYKQGIWIGYIELRKIDEEGKITTVDFKTTLTSRQAIEDAITEIKMKDIRR